MSGYKGDYHYPDKSKFHIEYGTKHDDYIDKSYSYKSWYIDGGKGDDVIKGGKKSDYLYGDKDDDHLYGNDGKDYLWGGKGDDHLNGGKDKDHLWGGEGCDTFVFSDLNYPEYRHKDKDKDYGHDKDKDKDKDKDYGHDKDKDKDYGHDKDKDKDYGHDKDKDKDYGHDKDKYDHAKNDGGDKILDFEYYKDKIDLSKFKYVDYDDIYVKEYDTKHGTDTKVYVNTDYDKDFELSFTLADYDKGLTEDHFILA
jgi:Ca2+-binding RTX toxin-like protein